MLLIFLKLLIDKLRIYRLQEYTYFISDSYSGRKVKSQTEMFDWKTSVTAINLI